MQISSMIAAEKGSSEIGEMILMDSWRRETRMKGKKVAMMSQVTHQLTWLWRRQHGLMILVGAWVATHGSGWTYLLYRCIRTKRLIPIEISLHLNSCLPSCYCPRVNSCCPQYSDQARGESHMVFLVLVSYLPIPFKVHPLLSGTSLEVEDSYFPESNMELQEIEMSIVSFSQESNNQLEKTSFTTTFSGFPN